MSNRKQLWLALSALTATVPVADAGAAPTQAHERAGVTSSVNPDVQGNLAGEGARVLFVGSDVFRNEAIRTDAAGVTHLLFLDQSSLTIGPNSEVVIDRFVYDPKTGNGDLGLSATTGILRFVGGALSKTGKVSINTPVGSLGIRGGVTLVETNGADGDTVAWLVYGNELSGTSTLSGESRTVLEQEFGLRIRPDGSLDIVGPIEPAMLGAILAALRGPEVPPPEGQELPLPADFRSWLNELARQDARDDMRSDEDTVMEMMNRDVDYLAS